MLLVIELFISPVTLQVVPSLLQKCDYQHKSQGSDVGEQKAYIDDLDRSRYIPTLRGGINWERQINRKNRLKKNLN
jgi:hypothetical protein